MRQTYAPRLRNAIATSGNPALAAKVMQLAFDLAQERAKVALLKSAQVTTEFSMQYVRVATTELKTKLLNAIDATAKLIPLKETLNLIDMSSARYFSWIKRKVLCQLPDQSACPKLTPTKITSSEKSVIRELVTSKEYIHFSICSLALCAKRTGAVFASISAWHRIIREQGLRRPCVRIHPPKPEIGIRASMPNQYWHLDQSLLRLKNGTKICIRAIIDNFSRYVLAWQVTDDSGGIRTRDLFTNALQASKSLFEGREMFLGKWTTDDDLKLLQHSDTTSTEKSRQPDFLVRCLPSLASRVYDMESIPTWRCHLKLRSPEAPDKLRKSLDTTRTR